MVCAVSTINASNASAIRVRSLSPLLELAGTEIEEMEFALGKATAAVSGDGAEQQVNTGKST
jgi:hypothetical protein